MRLAAALLSAALAAAPAAPGGAAEPLKIRHAWVVITNTISPLIFNKPDILPHYGKSYVVEPIHFAGTTQEITAIATNEVDVITIAYSSLAIAVENAHLDDLRVVADGFRDGVGDLSSPYLVRNDSGIERIEDLKGKVLVVNSIGTAVDIGARAVLKQHGLEAGRDYTVVEGEFPMMGSMLLQHKADLIADVPPFTFAPGLQTGAHVLFHMKDAMGPSQMVMLAARAGWLAANRAALQDFFADLAHGIRWMLDPANREAAVTLAANASKIPRERLDSYYLTTKDYYHDPHGLPDLDALSRNIATQHALGFIRSTLDVRKYADLTFMEQAAAAR